MEKQTVEEMERAREALSACKVKIQTMEKAKQAIQAEADAAKAQWRQLLRDGDGSLTKEVQKLRAAARSGYELQEEYDALLQEEMPAILAGKQLELAEAANRWRDAAVKEVEADAKAAFDGLLQQHGKEIRRAMDMHMALLFSREIGQPHHLQEWGVLSEKTEMDAFKDFMQCLMNEVMKLPSEVEKPSVHAAMEDMDLSLIQSPAKRQMLKQAIQGNASAAKMLQL